MRALRHLLAVSQLMLPFQPRKPCGLLSALLHKVFFELAEASYLRSCLLLPIQLGPEERGQDRQSDRARYPRFIVRYLHLAQGQPTFECFNCDLNTPMPLVHTENCFCARLGAIGHDDFNVLRPIVTPFLGQDDRDITQIMECGAAPVRFMAGAALGTALRQRLHEVMGMFAVRKLPGAWHGKDIRPVCVGAQAPGGLGGNAGIRTHYDPLPPRWGGNGLQHLPKEDVLKPFDGRIHWCEGDRDAHSVPSRDEQDHRKPKCIRIMRAMARRMPQGMFPVAPVLQHTSPKKIENAIGRRRERTGCRRRHVTQHSFRFPWARPEHPQGRPLFQCRRQARLESLEPAFVWSEHQDHQHPTADQKVLPLVLGKVSLAWVEPLRYFAWDACTTPHVPRSWVLLDVGCTRIHRVFTCWDASKGFSSVTFELYMSSKEEL
jgi:hypothetical protein